MKELQAMLRQIGKGIGIVLIFVLVLGVFAGVCMGGILLAEHTHNHLWYLWYAPIFLGFLYALGGTDWE